MATRLATQRNFVTITPANANNETNNKHNSTSTTPEDVITITPAESADQNTSQNDSIQISHIMSQVNYRLFHTIKYRCPNTFVFFVSTEKDYSADRFFRRLCY